MPRQSSPPPEPLVLRVLREHRIALDAMEATVMRDMGTRWLFIERRLEADMSALAGEFTRRAATETVTQQMIWRSDSYKILQAQIAEEIKKYNKDYAVGYISQSQEQYARLGIRSAQDAITASYTDMIAAFNRINVGAVQSMIGFAGDGSPLYSLLKRDLPLTADAIANALINGIARGLGSVATARSMADGLGMGLDRALLIARTENSRAYRTASVEQYRQSGVTRGFKRLVKKGTACLGCLFRDGETFSIASQLDDHPNGKCMAIPLVEGVNDPKWEKGTDWFKNLPPERQREILGDKRYGMWKAGTISLDDMSGKTHSNVWGDAPRVVPLSEL